MKREIKFKSWHKDDKCFIGFYGYGLHMYENGQIYAGGMNVTSRIDLIQFTGLKDKNDKEIYEDDIIKVSDPDRNHRIQRVVFKDGAFCGYSPKKNIKYTLLDTLIRAHDVEVVGNARENPELMEAK